VADLNYSNHEMRSAMTDAMEYWVYEANIDGFRCDYADGVPYDFWQSTWKKLNAISGRKFIFFAEGIRNDHFTAGFDLNFSWNWYSAIKEVFNGQPASRIFNAHNTEYNQTPAEKHWLRFTTNHDESAWDATPVRLFNGTDGVLAASVVTIFTGGVPLIYGSQEVGVLNNVPFFQNSTINWNQNQGLLQNYQKILQFYASDKTARTGQNTVYSHTDVAFFKKTNGNAEVLVIANLRNRNVNFSIPSALENTEWNQILKSENITLSNHLEMKPFEFYILHN
jgi:glycosidase